MDERLRFVARLLDGEKMAAPRVRCLAQDRLQDLPASSLAFGNITGAMVLQGLASGHRPHADPWQPRKEVLSGVIVMLLATAWLRLNVRAKGLQLRTLLSLSG